ncbi:hypothetical protein [Thalassospira mesophila]|uniref:hypothetical protein n=1 Tax=Thalassospira mesophila TaxID=1293891 RepID=UPI001302591A|nr:hypothetical protein [Thalassospira mesophila]
MLADMPCVMQCRCGFKRRYGGLFICFSREQCIQGCVLGPFFWAVAHRFAKTNNRFPGARMLVKQHDAAILAAVIFKNRIVNRCIGDGLTELVGKS